MVCGAIVAIEIIVAHPTDAVHLPSILIAVAGPLIFLAGNMLFRRILGRRFPPRYLMPFIARPLLGWGVHATHASGLLMRLGMLLVTLPKGCSF
jgi:hypothetical protein